VAENYILYPQLQGVTNEDILKSIISDTERDLDITETARNVDFEFYWQEKCEKDENLKRLKKEQHGNSYKQAFIEKYIEKLLEDFHSSSEDSVKELTKKLNAARFEVFSLTISRLQHLDISIVFEYLPNLAFLTLTYGAKHVGMAYERPLFGMKMSDAKILKDCLRRTQSLCQISLPGNLIDDDLISILIKGLMLNKTITQIDLAHNKIGDSGARKIAKYVLQTTILTNLNLGDNCITYEGSRYLAQALKVNKSLIHLDLKLNRLDDKAGSKLCIDLLNNNSGLQFLGLSSNRLSNMFCESLSEYLKANVSLQSLDISCNLIGESSATTLKSSLEGNKYIVSIDVCKNQLEEKTIEEINEIVLKNYLKSSNISYQKLGNCKSYTTVCFRCWIGLESIGRRGR